MEKYTKHFIEKFLGWEREQEVESRDPISIVDDNKMGGFRFFDVDYITHEGKTYKSDKYNYSKWIFFGKRYTYNEMKEEYGKSPLYQQTLNQMLEMEYPYVCKTTEGAFVPMLDGAETYDELMAQNGKGSK